MLLELMMKSMDVKGSEGIILVGLIQELYAQYKEEIFAYNYPFSF